MVTEEILPVVIVDTREQCPLAVKKYPTIRDTLPVGDYGIWGFSDLNNPAFTVERKSLDDLVQSLTHERDRFMREIEKMRCFRFGAVLIESSQDAVAMHHYRSQATPQAILASLDAIQVRTGIHIVWAGDREGSVRQLEGWVRQFVRGIEKDRKRLDLKPE